MASEPVIRHEQADDAAAIAALVAAAFGRDAEAELVAALRVQQGLALSLVALIEDELVGHVALSPVSVAGRSGGGRWLGLAPLAVAPARQRGGIGRRLAQAALAHAAAAGASAVFVLGEPGYYSALGFAAAAGLGWRCIYDAPPAAFRVRLLGEARDRPPPGTVSYHAAFAAL